VGVDNGNLNVSATATGGPITTVTSSQTQTGGVGGVIPIGLQYNSDFTKSLSLIHKGSSAGNWDFLSFPATSQCPHTPGEPNVECNMQYGYTGKLTIWDGVSSQASRPDMYVTTEPGAGQPSFDVATNYRAAASASACISDSVGDSASTHSPKSPCAVTGVLVDWSKAGGGKSTALPMLGFAEMWVSQVTGKGSKAQIVASWITQEVPGGSFSTTTTAATYKDGAVAIQMLD
jgi:hypothetical protein